MPDVFGSNSANSFPVPSNQPPSILYFPDRPPMIMDGNTIKPFVPYENEDAKWDRIDAQRKQFRASLPNDIGSLIKIFKKLLKQRIDHWDISLEYWDADEIWLDKCNDVLQKFPRGYPETNCFNAWNDIFRLAASQVWSGEPEQLEELQKKWAEAEKICPHSRDDTTPPAAPPRNSNTPPPLAPQMPNFASNKQAINPLVHKLQIEKYGSISPGFPEKLQAAQDTIPLPLQNFVASKGFKIQAVSKIADYNPTLAKQQARGHHPGETYGELFGYTSPDSGRIIIAEKAKLSDRAQASPTIWQKVQQNYDPGPTFRHEFGHALDHSANNFSNSPTFQRAYAQDIRSIPNSEKQRFYYYLSPTEIPNTRGFRQEIFAELFANEFGGGPEGKQIDNQLQGYFPAVSKLIKSEVLKLMN